MMIRARLITARDDMFRQHKQEGKVAPIASQRGRSWRIMKSDVRLAMQLIGLDPIGSIVFPGVVNVAPRCPRRHLEGQFVGCTSIVATTGLPPS
jgi:hypothetical protein